MVRPPPLQLQYNNYPGLVVHHEPHYKKPFEKFGTRLYEINFRKLVIVGELALNRHWYLSLDAKFQSCSATAMNAFRCILAAHIAFEDRGVDRKQQLFHLSNVSTTLGVLYIVVACIELFGMISVTWEKLFLIRIYTYLAFVSALLVTMAGTIGALSYFLFADDLVRECIALTSDKASATKALFKDKPWPVTASHVPADAITQKCLDAWSAESWTQVISAFMFFLLPSALYLLIAYTYYCQMTDPEHPDNLCVYRPVPSAIRLEDAASAARASARRVPTSSRMRRAPEARSHVHAVKYLHGASRLDSNSGRQGLGARAGHAPTPQFVLGTSSTVSYTSPGPPSYSVSHEHQVVYEPYSDGVYPSSNLRVAYSNPPSKGDHR
ncbi:hypothetical protein FISHEDRAFT_63003 [Fistulina hepatica ATCC 64428]|uniref:Uncharacterized protein n=1 Tax=Fistulina hepatica ATCC 64428 TaxID=1128425 RepID=A0A0D7A207_9AGAR|nr:hypothetical protein FISHEDRAFT_63003 [Fistulina hepatica ATCC 64428]